MERGNLRKLILLTMLFAVTTTFACSAARDVYDVSSLAVDSVSDLVLPDDKPVLKKKILVAPVINMAEVNTSLAEGIRQDCISHLSRDEYLLITALKQWGNTAPAYIQKSYGAVINPEYAQTAEKMGMNVLLTCIIHPLEITRKRTGIWPFRRDVYNVLISISINALDTVNGTLVVYDSKSENIKFEKNKPLESEDWVPDENILRNEVASMTKDLCSSVIEKLRKQPWQSTLRIDNDNLVIMSGRDIGIDENTVFEIYKKGDPVQSYSGSEFYVLGEKLGETRVKSLSKDKAVLAAEVNGDMKHAAFVKVKRSED